MMSLVLPGATQQGPPLSFFCLIRLGMNGYPLGLPICPWRRSWPYHT